MSRARLDNPGGASVSPEDVQDIVGAEFINSTSVEFLYDDGAGTVTATIPATAELQLTKLGVGIAPGANEITLPVGGQIDLGAAELRDETGILATDSHFAVFGAGGTNWIQLYSNQTIEVNATGPTNDTLVSYVDGDPQYRFQHDAAGKEEWGDGANPPDVSLERLSANLLGLGAGDSLQVDRILSGPGAGDDLTLKPGNTSGTVTLDFQGNTVASGVAGLVPVVIDDTLDAIHTVFTIAGGQTINPSVNNFGIRALVVGGTWVIDGSTTGTPFLVFNFAPTVQLTGPGGGSIAGTVNTGGFTGYQAGMTTDIATDNSFLDVSQIGRSFHDITAWTRTAGAGSATFATYTTMNSFPNLGAGWSCTTALRCFNIGPTNNGSITLYEGVVLTTSGTGTYTDFRGFVVDTGATNTFTNPPISYRSVQAVTQMRHRGPGVFGADAAPSGVSVALEIQSTTQALLLPRMTTAQKNALTAIKGMVVYDTTTDTVEAFQGVGAGAWAAM